MGQADQQQAVQPQPQPPLGSGPPTPNSSTSPPSPPPLPLSAGTWLVGMPSASAILCSSCATSIDPPSE
jgi:hypothetical protein